MEKIRQALLYNFNTAKCLIRCLTGIELEPLKVQRKQPSLRTARPLHSLIMIQLMCVFQPSLVLSCNSMFHLIYPSLLLWPYMIVWYSGRKGMI